MNYPKKDVIHGRNFIPGFGKLGGALKMFEDGFKRFGLSTAYTLINCEIGCETAVIDELRLLPQVIEAAEIYGSSYDIIAKVTAETESKLKEIIRKDIRRIGKVKSTQTMMVAIKA